MLVNKRQNKKALGRKLQLGEFMLSETFGLRPLPFLTSSCHLLPAKLYSAESEG